MLKLTWLKANVEIQEQLFKIRGMSLMALHF